MAIYVKGNNKVTDIFANVNGSKKRIKSVWVNKNGIVTRVFGDVEREKDPYEVAPASAYSNWDYTLDDENGIITLNYYKESETDVIVYANYVVGGKTYKTQLASNTNNTNYMFNGSRQTNCKKIKTIKFSKNIDTSNVTNMSYMFNQCTGLTSLDISGFDTSNVTDMSHMFASCRAPALTNLDVSNFDTSNVTNMNSMFNDCRYLTSLDVSNFDTSKVTDMQSMFSGLWALKNLDVSNFDTSKVTSMYQMFYGCSALTSLNISSFDTGNVTDMGHMFYGCSPITSLDISNFDTSNVTNMQYMFGRSTLRTIYVDRNKWITSQANTSNMFYSCGVSSVTYK